MPTGQKPNRWETSLVDDLLEDMINAMQLADRIDQTYGGPPWLPALPYTELHDALRSAIVERIPLARKAWIKQRREVFFMWVASAWLGRIAQSQGGILLHAALAEGPFGGVVFTGQSGAGKSTTSKRLPSHWHSWSDDVCLIMPSEEQGFLAYPWPTWSEFAQGGMGGSWDISHAVPLKAICLIEKSNKDHLEPFDRGLAFGHLLGLVEQASSLMDWFETKERVRTSRLERWKSITALIEAVPPYRLMLTLNGAFWELLEATIS